MRLEQPFIDSTQCVGFRKSIMRHLLTCLQVLESREEVEGWEKCLNCKHSLKSQDDTVDHPIVAWPAMKFQKKSDISRLQRKA
jgi:hypothetical protein